MLAAASIASDEMWAHDRVTHKQAVCLNRIKWIELRLGRLAHVLAWQELDRGIRAALSARGYSTERMSLYDSAFDPMLGMLLLRTDCWNLARVATLPDTLSKLDLPLAAAALVYALGYEDDLPPELVGDAASAGARLQFFREWRDQPAAEALPAEPLLNMGQFVSMESNVLGCHITVECQTSPHA